MTNLELVHELYEAMCTVNSAFGKVNRAFLIKSSQDYLTASGNTEEDVCGKVKNEQRCHFYEVISRMKDDSNTIIIPSSERCVCL